MNPKMKQKWIEALRSGRYKQNFERSLSLKTDDGYNCLGVLLEELDLVTWIKNGDRYYYINDQENTYLGIGNEILKNLNADEYELYKISINLPFSIVAILLELHPNL